MRKAFAIVSLMIFLLLTTGAAAWYDSGYYTYNNGWRHTGYNRNYGSYYSYSYPSYSYYSGTGHYYTPTNTIKRGTVYQRHWRGYSQTVFVPSYAW